MGPWVASTCVLITATFVDDTFACSTQEVNAGLHSLIVHVASDKSRYVSLLKGVPPALNRPREASARRVGSLERETRWGADECHNDSESDEQ